MRPDGLKAMACDLGHMARSSALSRRDHEADRQPGTTARPGSAQSQQKQRLVRHTERREHDGGDFYSPEYLDAWLTVIAASPHVGFYTYTKEAALFHDVVEPAPPPNFRWVYSLGGKQDVLLKPGARVADVFPTESAIERAGFHSQAASDLLAVDGPSPVGMAANNIPKLRRRQGARTFGQWQAEAEGRDFPFPVAA